MNKAKHSSTPKATSPNDSARAQLEEAMQSGAQIVMVCMPSDCDATPHLDQNLTDISQLLTGIDSDEWLDDIDEEAPHPITTTSPLQGNQEVPSAEDPVPQDAGIEPDVGHP